MRRSETATRPRFGVRRLDAALDGSGLPRSKAASSRRTPRLANQPCPGASSLVDVQGFGQALFAHFASLPGNETFDFLKRRANEAAALILGREVTKIQRPCFIRNPK